MGRRSLFGVTWYQRAPGSQPCRAHTPQGHIPQGPHISGPTHLQALPLPKETTHPLRRPPGHSPGVPPITPESDTACGPQGRALSPACTGPGGGHPGRCSVHSMCHPHSALGSPLLCLPQPGPARRSRAPAMFLRFPHRRVTARMMTRRKLCTPGSPDPCPPQARLPPPPRPHCLYKRSGSWLPEEPTSQGSQPLPNLPS